MLPLAFVLLVAVVACESAEEAFVGARLEDLCQAAVPACDVQASCVLREDRYVRLYYPGGQRLVVVTDEPDQVLRLRLLLLEPQHPGTELLVQAFEPGCGAFDEVHLLDVDLFAHAGEDHVLQFDLEAEARGDHLLELFSDMTAEALLTVEVR